MKLYGISMAEGITKASRAMHGLTNVLMLHTYIQVIFHISTLSETKAIPPA